MFELTPALYIRIFNILYSNYNICTLYMIVNCPTYFVTLFRIALCHSSTDDARRVQHGPSFIIQPIPTMNLLDMHVLRNALTVSCSYTTSCY